MTVTTSHGTALACGLMIGVAAGCWGKAASAESRSFVVSYFYEANWSDGKTDCPDGTNPSAIDFYRTELARAGHSHEEIENALKDFPGEAGVPQPWVPLVMTRGNGKDNVYIHPTTMPDPGLKVVQGKYAYGFNLDGKGAASPNSFEEPDTHELGVNNQLYRVVGCIRSHRGLPPPGRPIGPEIRWDVARNVMPAWLITVSSAGTLAKDGDVTVAIDRATDRITRDASGTAAQADMTYQTDPDPRFHNLLKGRIQNGIVTTTAPAHVRIVADPAVMPVFDFSEARLRLELKPDGTVRGMIGGYQPWRMIYYDMSKSGYVTEYPSSIDSPAVYYALRRNADGDPDPGTGENRGISSTYKIEAVPAFVVSPGGAGATRVAADK